MPEPGFRIVPVIQASQSRRRRRFDPLAVTGWALALGFPLAFWVGLIAWMVSG